MGGKLPNTCTCCSADSTCMQRSLIPLRFIGSIRFLKMPIRNTTMSGNDPSPPIVPARGKALASRPATGQDSCNKHPPPHITPTYSSGAVGLYMQIYTWAGFTRSVSQEKNGTSFCPSGVICTHRLFPIYITTPIALSRSSPIVPKTEKRLTVGPHP